MVHGVQAREQGQGAAAAGLPIAAGLSLGLISKGCRRRAVYNASCLLWRGVPGPSRSAAHLVSISIT